MRDILLFDLDGTLTDSAPGITNAVKHALAYRKIFPATTEELYPFVGPPLDESFMKYYGFSKEEAKEMIVRYREYYADKGLFENEVYPGIEKMLIALRTAGKTTVVATSKPEVYAVKILERFGLAPYLDGIFGAAFDETRTRKADVIAYALERLGGPDRERCMMIGDRDSDVRGARENGIPCTGVLYGYGSREELEQAGADLIAGTVEELKDHLLGI